MTFSATSSGRRRKPPKAKAKNTTAEIRRKERPTGLQTHHHPITVVFGLSHSTVLSPESQHQTCLVEFVESLV